MDYKKAIEKITSTRRTELLEASALFDSLMQNNPKLYEVETAIRKLNLSSVKGEKVDARILKQLYLDKEKILKSLGVNSEMLSPSPACKICGDSGLTKNKTYCACVKSLAINSGENICIPLHDFSSSDFSLFDAAYREHTEKVYGNIKNAIETYPNNKKRNITIFGATGTGKTYLAGCAATLALERGFSVLAISAFDFVNRMLSYHTTFDNKKLEFMRPVLDCNLLILDDLGTESILKNVTVEYLYTVINERMNNNKITMITSNLSKDALLTRYGERIYSRLFDKVLSYANILTSSDLRLKKRDTK